MIVNSPLYPFPNSPRALPPVPPSLTFFIETKSPVAKLCGFSAVIVITLVPLLYVQLLINLGFLLNPKSALVSVSFFV